MPRGFQERAKCPLCRPLHNRSRRRRSWLSIDALALGLQPDFKLQTPSTVWKDLKIVSEPERNFKLSSVHHVLGTL